MWEAALTHMKSIIFPQALSCTTHLELLHSVGKRPGQQAIGVVIGSQYQVCILSALPQQLIKPYQDILEMKHGQKAHILKKNKMTWSMVRSQFSNTKMMMSGD